MAGYSIAASGSAAAFLDTPTRPPACMILNQHMPNMSGPELVASPTLG
jgi:FixJ family two-component response regulator